MAIRSVFVVASIALFFSPAVVAQKVVKFTESYHPKLSQAADVQKLFNDGALLLKVDDDGPGTGAEDDVSLLVKFDISKARSNTFPDQSSASFPLNERFDYRHDKYLEIRSNFDGNQLRRASFANLKIVKKGHDFSGWAYSPNKTIIFTQKAIASTSVWNSPRKVDSGSVLLVG